MPDIPMGVTGAALVERYRNERKIELAYEQHRYFDIRRWMIAPDVIKNAQGIDIRYPYGGGKQVYSITKYRNGDGRTNLISCLSSWTRYRRMNC